MSRWVGRWATALAAAVLTLSANAQCAMCRTALESEGGALGRAFGSGVLFLLPIPFVAVGVVSLLWLSEQRRRQVALDDEGSVQKLVVRADPDAGDRVPRHQSDPTVEP